VRLTIRQTEQILQVTMEWQTPLRIGGTNGRAASAILKALCRRGICEWKWRSEGSGVAGVGARGSKVYRLTATGLLFQRKIIERLRG